MRRTLAESSSWFDPSETVRTDVERLRSASAVSPRIAISGYAYDLESGVVTPVVSP